MQPHGRRRTARYIGRETRDHMDCVPARPTGSQVRDCSIVDRLSIVFKNSSMIRSFSRYSLVLPSCTRQTSFELHGNTWPSRLPKAVHLLSGKRRRIELPKMNLRDVMIEGMANSTRSGWQSSTCHLMATKIASAHASNRKLQPQRPPDHTARGALKRCQRDVAVLWVEQASDLAARGLHALG